MFTKSKILREIEIFFLSSPLVVTLMSIFNFTDTKFILSRLIPIVCIYSLIKYRRDFKKNINSKLNVFFLLGTLWIIIFCFYHIFRGDEFSIARTLITSLVYLICIPWRLISKTYIFYLISISSIICGLNAFYESFILDIPRVGIVTNPIPYALYVSFLLLSCLYFIFNSKLKTLRIMSCLGGLLTLSAIIMTEVRGIIIFIPISILYLCFSVFKISIRNIFILSVFSFIITLFFYFAFQKDINSRIEQTKVEFSLIKKDNLSSSIGIRLALWNHGLDVINQAPIFGVGDIALQESISHLANPGAAQQPHLHNQYLDFLARYGILGSIVIITFFLSLIIKIKDSGIEYSGHPLINSMLIMLILAGLTDVPLYHTHIIYLLIIFLGILRVNLHQDTDEIS
ncbi:TPA: O-antigen ligase family protein [Vibrio cholerae]|nr:O-antigen ligase family protein [Vibrio cholerae]